MDKFSEMEKKFAQLNQQLDYKINLINQRYQETMDLIENYQAQRKTQLTEGLNMYRDELLGEARSSLIDDIDRANQVREKYRPLNQSVETIPEFSTLRSSKTYAPANKALGMLKLTYPRMSRYEHWSNFVDDRNKKRDELISRNTSTRYVDHYKKKWCTRNDGELLKNCRKFEEVRGAVALGVDPSNFLDRAIKSKDYQMLSQLLEMGAKPNKMSLFDVLTEAEDNSRSWTENDVIAFFEQLIRHGADVNYRRFQHLSLTAATMGYNFPRAALLLMRSGAVIDDPVTAYKVALSNDEPEVLQQVIDQHGNFTQFGGEERVWTLMHAGPRTLRLLINNGLNLNDEPMLTYHLLQQEDDSLSRVISREGNLTEKTIKFLKHAAKTDKYRYTQYVRDWLNERR